VAPQTRCSPTGKARSEGASHRARPSTTSMGARGRKWRTGTRRMRATSSGSGTRTARDRRRPARARGGSPRRARPPSRARPPRGCRPRPCRARSPRPPRGARCPPESSPGSRLPPGSETWPGCARSPSGRSVSTRWASPSSPGRAARGPPHRGRPPLAAARPMPAGAPAAPGCAGRARRSGRQRGREARDTVARDVETHLASLPGLPEPRSGPAAASRDQAISGRRPGAGVQQSGDGRTGLKVRRRVDGRIAPEGRQHVAQPRAPGSVPGSSRPTAVRPAPSRPAGGR